MEALTACPALCLSALQIQLFLRMLQCEFSSYTLLCDTLGNCDFFLKISSLSSSVKADVNLGPVSSSETNTIILPSNACTQLPLPLPTSLQATAIASTTSALQAVVAAAQEKQPIMVTAEQLEKQQTQWSRVDLLLETLQQQQVEIKVFQNYLCIIHSAILDQPVFRFNA